MRSQIMDAPAWQCLGTLGAACAAVTCQALPHPLYYQNLAMHDSLSMNERLVEGVSLQGYSRCSNGFKNHVADTARWLPPIFQRTVWTLI